MQNEQMIQQQDFYTALTYYGFLTDLKIVEAQMAENEPLSIDENDNAIKNFWNKNFVNGTRRKSMQKLSEKKNEILNQIADFKSKHSNEAIFAIAESEEKLYALKDEVFNGKNADIGKVFFALRFSLDAEIKYENRDKIHADISKMLFDNEKTISELNNNLKQNYIELVKAPFVKMQKDMLLGLGISALIAIALPPLLMGGAIGAALITPALVEGALFQIGIGVAATAELVAVYSSVLLGGALIGTEIAKQIKIKSAKESLRKASPEDISLLLAIKATLIQYLKKTTNQEGLKEELDSCLQQLNDLRADAEYLLIVERLDAEKTKKKIDICNNFIGRLTSIVGL